MKGQCYDEKDEKMRPTKKKKHKLPYTINLFNCIIQFNRCKNKINPSKKGK